MAKAALKEAKTTKRPWIWMQGMNIRDQWAINHIPAGEAHAPKIKQLSTSTDGTCTFYCYRDMKCVGIIYHKNAAKGLEEAKVLCQKNRYPVKKPEDEKDEKDMKAYLDGRTRDVNIFKKMSPRAQNIIAQMYPYALPKTSDLESKKIKVRSNRSDLKSGAEKRAEAMALPVDEKIVLKKLKDKNPKKEGTDAHMRWELLRQCGGKTVGEFIAVKGNPTTLKNAVKTGYVSVKGMDGE